MNNNTNTLAIYEDRPSMIDWAYRVLQTWPAKEQRRETVTQTLRRLEAENPDELHNRTRRAMRLMFEAGRSGNGRNAFCQGILG